MPDKLTLIDRGELVCMYLHCPPVSRSRVPRQGSLAVSQMARTLILHVWDIYLFMQIGKLHMSITAINQGCTQKPSLIYCYGVPGTSEL